MKGTPMQFLRLKTASAAAALALSAFFGLIGTGPAVGAPATVQVTIRDFDFQPMTVIIPVGTTVTWKNLDGEPHTVTGTGGSFRSPALDQDDTFSFKFTKPGVYPYICTIHPRMRATVTVR
jgi:plastocyanin